MKDWAGGAKRSKAMPDWHMYPRKALKGILTRFTIGMKYGINNWRRALSVPREKWHDGEPGPGKGAEDKSALGFIRQFIAHGDEHLSNVFDLVDKPKGAVSENGDDLMANFYAWGWNVLGLIDYAIENEDMVREALSQYPEGSPKRRQDLAAEPILCVAAGRDCPEGTLATKFCRATQKYVCDRHVNCTRDEPIVTDAQAEGAQAIPEKAPASAYEQRQRNDRAEKLGFTKVEPATSPAKIERGQRIALFPINADAEPAIRQMLAGLGYQLKCSSYSPKTETLYFDIE